MAKLRSPILGYNHNIRFRGLVFHVQTEDSGVANPHVFTHLFHGGVILTTRKLVYDPSASDDAVKALMQAQHKAVLRDLKRGLFDDKIDQYLGGTEGLLPRGADDGGGDAGDAPAAAAPAPAPATADATVPTPVPASVAVPEAVAVRARTGSPGPASVSIPAPTRVTGRMPAMSPPTPMAPGDGAPPPPAAPPSAGPHERAQTQVMGSRQALATPPPVVVTRPSRDTAQPPTRREVSAAFQAIMVGDGEAPAGGALVEVHDEPAEIHAAAPPSAPPLPGVAAMPGARASEYAQHRRRESAPAIDLEPPPPTPTAPRPGPRTTPPPAVVSAEARALRQSSSMPVQRPSAPPPIPPASPPPLPPSRPSAPVLRTPQARAPSTPPPTFPPRAPTVAARPRSATSSGVVVTRPAVIVGAPPRNIGGSAAPPPVAAAPVVPPAAPPPAGRVRVAREDSESGMFGQDLISEKSLDEVILAYLSEDPSD